MAPQPAPATAESGFTQSVPPLENPFTSDSSFQRVLAWYLPQDVMKTIESDLTKFAEEAISDQIRDWVANAETQLPYVKSHNVWGQRYDYDRLVTSEGWKQLGKWGAKNGVIATPYEPAFREYKRIVQHAKLFIFIPSGAMNSCPVSMSSGAARLIRTHAAHLPESHPHHEFLRRLISREDHWTTGQWMTERAGGSDVHNTETYATYSPLPKKAGEFGTVEEGDYLISGFKFFSSATDANMACLLAKNESGELSTFIAPLRKTIVGPDGKEREVSNGVRIHRLKNKMGTKELPTAELELKDMRAHMIGSEGRGIATIASLLNVSRSHNWVSAASCFRRALSIVKSFTKARTTLNQPLSLIPMHLRLLAGLEVKHRGTLQLCFFSAALLSFVDNGFPKDVPPSYAPLPRPGDEAEVVFRAMAAVTKAVVCKVSLVSIQECQEAMGGVGYMDESDDPENNISRLYRDTAVTPIWEGTTNILSSDLVRHLLKGSNLDIFSTWVDRAIQSVNNPAFATNLRHAWAALYQRLGRNRTALAAALAEGRQIMFSLAWIVAGVLLVHDAQRDGDEVATEIASRWVLDGKDGVGEFALAEVVHAGTHVRQQSDAERTNWDCRVVWGVDLPKDSIATGYRTGAAKL